MSEVRIYPNYNRPLIFLSPFSLGSFVNAVVCLALGLCGPSRAPVYSFSCWSSRGSSLSCPTCSLNILTDSLCNMLGCTVNFLLSLLHSFLCLMLRTIQIFQSLEETESTVKILHPTITPHLLFFCLPPVTVNHCCHFLMCPSRLKKMCTHTHKQIVLSSISYTKERMLCMMCTGGIFP